MTEKYIKIENLSVSSNILNFVNKELLPGTKINKKISGEDLANMYMS